MRSDVIPLASPALRARARTVRRGRRPAGLPLLRSPLEPWRTWLAANGLDWPEPVEALQFNDIGLMCDGLLRAWASLCVRLKLGAPWLEHGSLVRLGTSAASRQGAAQSHAHSPALAHRRHGSLVRMHCGNGSKAAVG